VYELRRSIASSAMSPNDRRALASRRAVVLVGLLVALVAAVVLVLTAGPQRPFAFSPDKRAEFERAAAAGQSHLLYSKSPGGAIAAARRVDALREPIAAAARGARVDPRLLEGMVFLESGGRADAVVGGDPANAAGVSQILPETGRNLLRMRIDLAASRRLTEQIGVASEQGQMARVAALERRRRQVDERFDPAKALAATGRYLAFAHPKFGRDDFAVASYHMGVGNLAEAIRAYVGPEEERLARTLVEEEGLTYAQLYFDSTPFVHRRAYRLLARLGDDSATYLWRVLAAREIVRLYREDPEELRRLNALHIRYGSGEAVLRPPGSTPVFENAGALRRARSRRVLLGIPNESARRHFAIDPDLGAGVRRGEGDPGLYTALRREALATLYYIADRVHQISRARRPLLVAAAVRDRDYEARLPKRELAGPRSYSLYTTGYSFDITRRYEDGAQAEAFQAMLDRLEALNVIAWHPHGDVIHVTVSERSSPLLPLLQGEELEG
jgi:hypothetical protein